jgi:putative phosphoesterase
MDNKKLLVLSDTHGNINALRAVFRWAKDHIPPNDTIVSSAFLGDGVADLQYAAETEGFYTDWKIVSGNNDYNITMPEVLTFEFAEHQIFMCHGHRYSSYGGYNTLVAAARNSNADIALCGHSHIPFNKTMSGVRIINPGSVGRPRSRIGATFAVIKCPEDKPLIVNFFGIGVQNVIHELEI